MKGFISFVLILGIALVPALAKDLRLDILPMETAPGPCPKPKTITDFDPTKLVGTWYDIKRYKNTITKGSCGTATYTWFPNNSSYIVPYQMKEYKTNVLSLTASDIYHGKFKTGLNGIQTPFDYWLIGTDYENYHIVYTCIELVPLLLNSQSINIYSRKTTLDDASLGAALTILQQNKLDATILRDVVQDNAKCGRSFLSN